MISLSLQHTFVSCFHVFKCIEPSRITEPALYRYDKEFQRSVSFSLHLAVTGSYLSPGTNFSGVSPWMIFYPPHLFLFAALSFMQIIEWINQTSVCLPNLLWEALFWANLSRHVSEPAASLCRVVQLFSARLTWSHSVCLKAAKTIGVSDSWREETVFRKDFW